MEIKEFFHFLNNQILIPFFSLKTIRFKAKNLKLFCKCSKSFPNYTGRNASLGVQQNIIRNDSLLKGLIPS